MTTNHDEFPRSTAMQMGGVVHASVDNVELTACTGLDDNYVVTAAVTTQGVAIVDCLATTLDPVTTGHCENIGLCDTQGLVQQRARRTYTWWTFRIFLIFFSVWGRGKRRRRPRRWPGGRF